MAADAERHRLARHVEPPPERHLRLLGERERHVQRQRLLWRGDKVNSGFTYDPIIHYSEAANIGAPDKVCPHCRALTWTNEPSVVVLLEKSSFPQLRNRQNLSTHGSQKTPQSPAVSLTMLGHMTALSK